MQSYPIETDAYGLLNTGKNAVNQNSDINEDNEERSDYIYLSPKGYLPSTMTTSKSTEATNASESQKQKTIKDKSR